jgi:hypothetical protein
MMVYVSAGFMIAVCLALDDPWLECPQGTRAARRSWALINISAFSFFRAARRSEVERFRCRRVVCSIERLRERQEAAGIGLKS